MTVALVLLALALAVTDPLTSRVYAIGAVVGLVLLAGAGVQAVV